MRKITSHQINECNSAIDIEADAVDPNNGNASHYYRITIREVGAPVDTTSDVALDLTFQHGPIKEVGTNGITHEALLAILVDRLEGFQTGVPSRLARGVEGTHEV